MMLQKNAIVLQEHLSIIKLAITVQQVVKHVKTQLVIVKAVILYNSMNYKAFNAIV